jgi:hypothetical protein
MVPVGNPSIPIGQDPYAVDPYAPYTPNSSILPPINNYSYSNFNKN